MTLRPSSWLQIWKISHPTNRFVLYFDRFPLCRSICSFDTRFHLDYQSKRRYNRFSNLIPEIQSNGRPHSLLRVATKSSPYSHLPSIVHWDLQVSFIGAEKENTFIAFRASEQGLPHSTIHARCAQPSATNNPANPSCTHTKRHGSH